MTTGIYDRETSIWRARKITVFPTLGDHELRGELNVALANYFARFPILQEHRFYSVPAANTLLLGEWLRSSIPHLVRLSNR